jgi:hypothetical protein
MEELIVVHLYLLRFISQEMVSNWEYDTLSTNPLGLALTFYQSFQLADHSLAVQERIHHNTKTFQFVTVEDVKGKKYNPVFQSIMHEINAPLEVRCNRTQQRHHNMCREPILVLSS